MYFSNCFYILYQSHTTCKFLKMMNLSLNYSLNLDLKKLSEIKWNSYFVFFSSFTFNGNFHVIFCAYLPFLQNQRGYLVPVGIEKEEKQIELAAIAWPNSVDNQPLRLHLFSLNTIDMEEFLGTLHFDGVRNELGSIRRSFDGLECLSNLQLQFIPGRLLTKFTKFSARSKKKATVFRTS